MNSAGPSWAYCTNNYPVTADANALGVAVSPGQASVDGTAVTLLSALTHDVEFLTLRLGLQSNTGNVNCNTLMDLLIDPAGGTNWSVLIEDMIAGGLALTSIITGDRCAPVSGYDFPIWIPAGASLGVRAQIAHSTTVPVIRVLAIAYGGNRNPASWWCGQRVSTINSVPANSNGGTLTPGDTVFSSWADLGSPIGAACGALQWGVGGIDDVSWTLTERHFLCEFGVAGQRIGSPFFRAHFSNEQGLWMASGPIFQQLPAGTQLQVRSMANATPVGAMGFTAYAVH